MLLSIYTVHMFLVMLFENIDVIGGPDINLHQVLQILSGALT